MLVAIMTDEKTPTSGTQEGKVKQASSDSGQGEEALVGLGAAETTKKRVPLPLLKAKLNALAEHLKGPLSSL